MKAVRLLRAAWRRWRTTRHPPAEPGQLALASLQADPALLERLPRHQARGLAEQAGLVAQRVAAGTGTDTPELEARGAANRVLRLVREFVARDAVCGGTVDDMVRSAAAREADGLGGLLHTLLADGSRLGEAAARLSVHAVAALGPDGLRRLDRFEAERLMAAAARGAAAATRAAAEASAAADRAATAGQEKAAGAALAAIETLCGQWDVLPLPPVLAGGRRNQAEHLVELWRDGVVLAGRTGAGERRRMWADARDGHAFGAVWLMPSLLTVLVEAEAERLAADARVASATVLRCGAGRAGARLAMEAARTVLFSCGAVPPPVRTEAEPVHAAHA